MDKHSTNTKLSPSQVVIIYNDRGKNRFYLENRTVKSVGGKLTLDAPVPLGEDVFRNIAAAFVKKQGANLRFESLIAEHILYGYNELGRRAIMWYRPAGQRLLNFSGGTVKGYTEALTKVPATLYVIKDKALHVYALMNDSRPTMDTRLYRAPFFNIYDDGRVCLGSARVGTPTATYEGEAERYEKAFYMAEQNGGIGTHTKTPMRDLWPKVIQSKAAFPSKEELQAHPKYATVSKLITNLIAK